MKTPQVSIIMPCHNGEKYLQESIQSVINQTFADWELLVIDDNSTDNSVNIIEEFCKNDKRIKLFHTIKSSGSPSTPRNVGIENAQGRFIAFLDCDDIWLSTKLSRQIPLFLNNQVAVVFSFYGKMNVEGILENRIIKSPTVVNFKHLLKGDCIGNLTGIYDSKKVGKVFQKEIHHEDYLMYLKILQKKFIALNTNTCEAFYRISDNSVSANKFQTMKWHWNILRNELKLSFFVAIYNFFYYAVKGFLKFLK